MIAWRIEGEGARFAVSGDRLVVLPDDEAKSFGLYVTNGGREMREKIFLLTTSDDLTAVNGLEVVPPAPELTAVTPVSLVTSPSPQTVTLSFSGRMPDIVSVDVTGPGVSLYDIPVSNALFSCTFAAAGTYTIAATAWSKVPDAPGYWIYTCGSATVRATSPDPDPPYYDNADIRGVFITIDGADYYFTLQPDRKTWVAAVPYGFDLSSVTPDIKLWPGAGISPEPPYDFRQAVEVEVTAPDGKTKKKYLLIVELEAPPAIETLILDALPDNARARLVQNDDGTWAVEIVFPFDPDFDPSEIVSIAIEAPGITGIRAYYVDENGDEIELDLSSCSHRSAGGERLKITGTAASRAAVESARIMRVTVNKKSDAATYYQVLDMPLSLIPGGTPPIDPDPDPDPVGGSSGGCNAGAGLLLISCGAALLFAVKRKK